MYILSPKIVTASVFVAFKHVYQTYRHFTSVKVRSVTTTCFICLDKYNTVDTRLYCFSHILISNKQIAVIYSTSKAHRSYNNEIQFLMRPTFYCKTQFHLTKAINI